MIILNPYAILTQTPNNQKSKLLFYTKQYKSNQKLPRIRSRLASEQLLKAALPPALSYRFSFQERSIFASSVTLASRTNIVMDIMIMYQIHPVNRLPFATATFSSSQTTAIMNIDGEFLFKKLVCQI